jgi:peroxiredoxin
MSLAAAAAADTMIAPPFALPDSRGNVVRLADLLARGPVVVVFYRGHWCPYCRRYLAKLAANHERFVERGANLVAIAPEPPATAARLGDELGLRFPLLCDAAAEAIDAYGARNRFTSARTILPHPAVFVIDAAGAVRFRSIDRDIKRRTPMHSIFRALDGLRL